MAAPRLNLAGDLPRYEPAAETLPGGRKHDTMLVRDTEFIVDSLNAALGLENGLASREVRTRFMMRRLLQMMGRDADSEMMLHDDLHLCESNASPSRDLMLLAHLAVGPNFDDVDLDRTMQQHLADECGGLREMGAVGALGNMSTPYTVVFSEDAADAGWFDDFNRRRLQPNGNSDVMVSYWSGNGQRLTSLSVYRREGEGRFTQADRARLSLMTRTIAPVVDREFYRQLSDDEYGIGQLTPRQREVLGCMLRGLSEKEAGGELHVSAHTIHSHVKTLYSIFSVNSRGELMAHFIDDRVRRLAQRAA